MIRMLGKGLVLFVCTGALTSLLCMILISCGQRQKHTTRAEAEQACAVFNKSRKGLCEHCYVKTLPNGQVETAIDYSRCSTAGLDKQIKKTF